MLLEIADEIVGMKMDGRCHLVNVYALMQMRVHIVLNDGEPVHFLRTMLEHSNGQ